MTGLGQGFQRARRRRAGQAAFNPAELTGLLAWYDPREGKTGDPVTALARKAGTGLGDLSSTAGPDDETDHLGFTKASSENMTLATAAETTTLHENGFVFVFAARISDVSGREVIIDNMSRGATRIGVTVQQNGTNINLYVANGSGTYIIDALSSGPSFGGTPGLEADTWHIVEAGFEPTLGAYIRVDGQAPVVMDPTGSVSASAPTYQPVIGAASSAIGPIGDFYDGDLGQMLFSGPAAINNRDEIDSVVSVFAAIYGVTIDPDGEFANGSGDTNTVLV